MLGRWNYTEAGILDRTHVRFYTLDTAIKLCLMPRPDILEYAYLFFPPSQMRNPWKRRILSVGQRRLPRVFAIGFVFHLGWYR